MALTKSPTARAVLASVSNAAGDTKTSAGFLVGYGVSGVATITNGATGPTVECTVRIEFSADNSAWVTGPVLGGGGTANSAVTWIPYALGIGSHGDWAYYRLVFTGNTGQAVTVEAADSSTSGI